MSKEQLEKTFKQKIRKGRLISLAIFIAFMALGIVSSAFCSMDRFELIYGIIFGFAIAFTVGIVLLVDIASLRYKSIDIDDCFVTFYRAMFGAYLYVDGELKDSVYMWGYCLEARIPNGTKVIVSLGRYSARMSFSQGHDSLDIPYYFET